MFSLEASVLALVGLGCGLTGAWAVTRLLRAFLYEVQPADVPTFVSVGAGLLAVTEVGLTKIRTHKRPWDMESTLTITRTCCRHIIDWPNWRYGKRPI
jgi:sensor histidine kinase regulating citrate/malate metabolism